MRLEQLSQVVQIDQWGSFNAAANYLGMTHQNIKRSVKSLESELGYQLFKRSSSGSSLTAEGELFLDFALETLNRYNDMLAKMQKLNEPSKEAFRENLPNVQLVTTVGSNAFLTPALFNLVNERRTGVSVDLLPLDECMEIVNGERPLADLVLVQQSHAYVLEHTKPAAHYHLYVIEVEKPVLFTSRLSPYSQLNSISADVLARIPLMTLSKNISFIEICGIDEAVHQKLNVVSTIGAPDAARELLRTGQTSIVTVPSSAGYFGKDPSFADSMVSVPIEVGSPAATALYARHDANDPDSINRVVDIFRKSHLDTFVQIY